MVKAMDLTPSPHGFAVMFATIIQGGDKKGREYVESELKRIYSSYEGGRLSPSIVNSLIRDHIRKIKQGGPSADVAMKEMTNIFTAAFGKKNPAAAIKHSRVTAAGRALLRKISETRPQLYAQVEKYATYPNQDDYRRYQDYDNAVDRAELRALDDILKRR